MAIYYQWRSEFCNALLTWPVTLIECHMFGMMRVNSYLSICYLYIFLNLLIKNLKIDVLQLKWFYVMDVIKNVEISRNKLIQPLIYIW